MNDLNKMQGGRDLDIMVAETLFGYKPDPRHGWYGWQPRPCAEADDWQEIDRLPKYSTDIGLAILVLNRIKQIADSVSIESTKNGNWKVTISRVHGSSDSSVQQHDAFLPAAICKAAIIFYINYGGK
jgi:hypothetical protein